MSIYSLGARLEESTSTVMTQSARKEKCSIAISELRVKRALARILLVIDNTCFAKIHSRFSVSLTGGWLREFSETINRG